MLELLGLIAGGLFRLLPEGLKILSARREADHEYRMTELQLKVDQARAAQAIDLVHAQGAAAADASELGAWADALRAQAAATGVRWVDALTGAADGAQILGLTCLRKLARTACEAHECSFATVLWEQWVESWRWPHPLEHDPGGEPPGRAI